MAIHSSRLAMITAALVIVGCGTEQPDSQVGVEDQDRSPDAVDMSATTPTIDDAREFVARVQREQLDFWEYSNRVGWLQQTHITFDTNWLDSRVSAEKTHREVAYANEAKRFQDLDLSADPDLDRTLRLIKLGIRLPAPGRDGAAEELATITTRLGTAYSTGQIDIRGGSFSADEIQEALQEIRDPKGEDPTARHSGASVTQPETEDLMKNLQNPDQLAEVWTKWRRNAEPMKVDYVRMVQIANEGALELGFGNVRDLWLSKYDLPSDQMVAEVDRLWEQVSPLYEELHCYVRTRLNEKYGNTVVPLGQPIRADLLGNMWAQWWSNIYEQVAPPGSDIGYDLTELLKAKEYDPRKMVKTGEGFFISLGFDPLPESFWERSLIEKPRDRELVCHASAWNLDNDEDLRIKMCTAVTGDDFRVVHHELGHNFYQRAYNQQPALFRDGAHDGFHEALGDFIALSVTPNYLARIGLLQQDRIPPPSSDLGLLMRTSLDKIAYLPFAILVDRWRWGVMSGEITPPEYNDAWWELRRELQGVVPPTLREAQAFDPGAKYHIPGNVPYLRYFLATILQFQFHEAACGIAGWEGPLHRCSIYENEEVGRRLEAMLKLGASRPWPEALEAFTGSPQMDAGAITRYFQPLLDYLSVQNQGSSCGWGGP
jgi:peptidyl-dipeptidase A